MRYIILLIACFLSSNAYSENFDIKRNASGFQWGMDTVKCPLEKESEKFFVIKLSSKQKDYSFQVQCHLQKKEQKKHISFVLLEENKMLSFNNPVKNKEPEFKFASIMPSFLNTSISGYVMRYNEMKYFGFDGNDKILSILSSLNEFQIMVDDKIDNKTKIFRFNLDKDSASLSDFNKFCSLDYFD